ncbi:MULTISPECIES: hypothetical protein [Limosilactobacillus]|nr:hypothetical protein [Limosilactobacillus panis]QZN93672.1 type II secretion system protein [Limosilactobacillus panis]
MKRDGFTALEMIIVLGLTALIFCLVTPMMTTSRNRINEQQFWRQFRQEWRYAQVQTQVNHYGTDIHYAKEKGAISFICNYRQRLVKIPATIQVMDFDDIEIKADGYVCPQTKVFHSATEHCDYRLTIQMARGEYDVKRERCVCNGG